MGDLNLDLFVRDVMRRRAQRPQREVAREIGVSASTVCRVEQGYVPDLISFGKFCRWLGADPCVYLNVLTPRKRGTIETERKRIADELAWVVAQFDALSHPELQQRLSELEHRLSRGEP